jgi:hypothetical protein
MAKALEPGTARRADEAARDAARVKRITCVHLFREDAVYRLPAANLSLDQRAVVLKQVGLSLDQIIAAGDVTLFVAVAVWLARRLDGERSLSWAQFQRHWPDDLTEDDVDLWAENTSGQRLDDDGNVIAEPDDEAVLDVAEVGAGDPES